MDKDEARNEIERILTLYNEVVEENRVKEYNEEILKKAREGNFDLIVIGARGISKMKEILIGSVSHGVTTHAPCPVLVVK